MYKAQKDRPTRGIFWGLLKTGRRCFCTGSRHAMLRVSLGLFALSLRRHVNVSLLSGIRGSPMTSQMLFSSISLQKVISKALLLGLATAGINFSRACSTILRSFACVGWAGGLISRPVFRLVRKGRIRQDESGYTSYPHPLPF